MLPGNTVVGNGSARTPPLARILVVDDDPRVVELVCLNLGLSGYHVGGAQDGAEGLAKALSGQFDLVILDVMMPKLSGFQVCEQLRYLPKTRALPVVMLTAKGMQTDKIAGFEFGADDYIVKPFDPRELEVRVRALLRRAGCAIPSASRLAEILEAGDVGLQPESLQMRIGERVAALTPTEFEVVYCLLQHTDQPVSLATMLHEIWGFDADGNVDMLRVHVSNIRKKLEDNPNRARYLLTVPNVGYRLAVSAIADLPPTCPSAEPAPAHPGTPDTPVASSPGEAIP